MTSQDSCENSLLETQIDELTRKVATEFGGLTEEKYEESQRPIIDVTTDNLDAYKYYLLGKEEFAAVHFTEAIDYFTKAVRLDSTFASAHMQLAGAYLFLGSREQKFKHLEKAMKFRDRLTYKEQIILDYDYALYKHTSPAMVEDG